MNYDPHAAVDFLIKNAGKFAEAKAQRVYLEQFRSSKKALLMGKSDAKTAVEREQQAYSHPEYLELLEGYRAAIETEEKLKWELTAAQLRIETWKAQTYMDGKVDRTMKQIKKFVESACNAGFVRYNSDINNATEYET